MGSLEREMKMITTAQDRFSRSSIGAMAYLYGAYLGWHDNTSVFFTMIMWTLAPYIVGGILDSIFDRRDVE